MRNRIAITGIGLITPVGRDLASFSAQIQNGISAIERRTYTLDGFPDLTLPVAPVDDFDPRWDLSNCKVKAWDRLSHFAIYAARQAVLDANVTGLEIDALILGSSTTSVETLDENYNRLLRGNGRISPMMIAKCMPNAPVSAVSMDLGIEGISYAVASACSSANQAIINAAALITSGAAKTALAGGVEASLSYTNLSAWTAMHVLTQDTCRPFCATRSGLVMGEGSTVFVLEDWDHAKARGATIYAELLGWGQSSDAKSLTTPDQGGIERALGATLKHAQLDPSEINYINAHGTGTELNDVTEAKALNAVFGAMIETVQVSSTKALHGHLLGAAGAIELAATIAGLKGGFAPPNVGITEPDPEIKLNLSEPGNRSTIKAALNASFALGGHNSVLAVGHSMARAQSRANSL